MNIKVTWKDKTVGEWLSAVAAVATLVVLICYAVYTSGLSAMNTLEIVFLVLAVLCNAAYFFIEGDFPIDVMGIVEIVAVACTAESFVNFLLASMNNLADLINGIQIFSGGTGSIPMIFGILIALVVISIIEIIACFMRKTKC